jgi:thiamine-monophosphate kinase
MLNHNYKLMSEVETNNDLSKIGEFGLIHLLTKKIVLKNKSSLIGVGDDGAVLDMGDMLTVVTTDMLTEGIHFNLVYSPLKHLGYKAVVVNLSDIYAMNAIPTQILVSIGISARFTTEMIEELYEGINLACSIYGVDLVGGDTTSSLTGMTISITAIGAAPKERIVYRSGAGDNDLICVTGDLGAAYMGLQLLERELQVFQQTKIVQPELEGHDYILERQLKPEARRDIINTLAEKEIMPTSMIDISDGLSSEILHLCKASNTGCKIFADKIPIDKETREMAQEFNVEPTTVSMNGGEDYELLFTAKIKDYEKIAATEGISIIGHITKKSEGTLMVTPDGSFVEISALGWNSFKMD